MNVGGLRLRYCLKFLVLFIYADTHNILNGSDLKKLVIFQKRILYFNLNRIALSFIT